MRIKQRLFSAALKDTASALSLTLLCYRTGPFSSLLILTSPCKETLVNPAVISVLAMPEYTKGSRSVPLYLWSARTQSKAVTLSNAEGLRL